MACAIISKKASVTGAMGGGGGDKLGERARVQIM